MMFLFLFGLSNVLIAATGTTASIILNPIFYKEENEWMTRHRLAPASGIIILLIGVVINRHILRRYANHSEREATQTALDVLACTSAFIAVTCGVLCADLWRDQREEKEE